jgi:hypothetical protein
MKVSSLDHYQCLGIESIAVILPYKLLPGCWDASITPLTHNPQWHVWWV